ncbi:MAG: ATP-binding protein [Flavobacterium sp.]|nr:ATP-binding protein [Flavobacterium sp.]
MAQFSKYTPLKLLFSYFLLLGLMGIAVWFLFKQQAQLNNQISSESTDKKQLIYTELIRDLYESDNYARIALQTIDETSKQNFQKKNASLISKIDFLKSNDLVADESLLDTLKIYLQDKEQNILSLRKLQQTSEKSPIGNVLQKIKNLEDVKGKLQLDNFIKNPNELSAYEKKVAEEYIAYLNANVPKDESNTISIKEADSVITASKKILEEAQRNNNQRSFLIKNKEIELLQNELVITQKLSDVIFKLRNAAEMEEAKIAQIKTANQKATLSLLQKAAFACIFVVLFFFVLLSFDFFKNKTYRKQLELEKQKTDQLLESREQLMTTVSHDIKTPLQSLIGLSEKLLATETQVKNRDALIKMKSATHYIEQLVSGLLDYVRMEKGKITVLDSQFDVNELIEETAQNIADLNQDKPVELVYNMAATEGFLLKSDRNKLRQILYNLIGNAFKFTSQGSVTVLTQKLEDTIVIAIIDTGIGISKDAINKVFKPFTQANNQIETLYGGTGLGLSICNRLIQLLNGKIVLESEQNVGSSFKIVLPITQEFPKDNLPKISLDVCLLLDDDWNQTELTKAVLEPHFNKIVTFTNGNKALEFLEHEQVSLIISDIQMPEISGFEFLSKVKAKPAIAAPIIAISGTVPLESEYLTDERFDFFLPKPYSANQLLGVISELSRENLVQQSAVSSNYPKFLLGFFGDDTEKMQAFLITYETDFKSDKEHFFTAIKNLDSETVLHLAHKMQTMISQFQEEDVVQILKTIEQKLKQNSTIDALSFECHNAQLVLNQFHQKIKRLIDID